MLTRHIRIGYFLGYSHAVGSQSSTPLSLNISFPSRNPTSTGPISRRLSHFLAGRNKLHLAETVACLRSTPCSQGSPLPAFARSQIFVQAERMMASVISYPCTFESCHAKFSSIEAMKEHKRRSPQHEYCALCNEDFADWAALLRHKIESDMHITCPVCSMDFATESAQQYHIEQV